MCDDAELFEAILDFPEDGLADAIDDGLTKGILEGFEAMDGEFCDPSRRHHACPQNLCLPSASVVLPDTRLAPHLSILAPTAGINAETHAASSGGSAASKDSGDDLTVSPPFTVLLAQGSGLTLPSLPGPALPATQAQSKASAAAAARHRAALRKASKVRKGYSPPYLSPFFSLLLSSTVAHPALLCLIAGAEGRCKHRGKERRRCCEQQQQQQREQQRRQHAFPGDPPRVRRGHRALLCAVPDLWVDPTGPHLGPPNGPVHDLRPRGRRASHGRPSCPR